MADESGTCQHVVTTSRKTTPGKGTEVRRSAGAHLCGKPTEAGRSVCPTHAKLQARQVEQAKARQQRQQRR